AVPKYTSHQEFPPPSSPGMGGKGKVTNHNSRARVKLPADLVGREDSGVAMAILLLGPLQDVYAPFFPGPLPCAALGVTVKGMAYERARTPLSCRWARNTRLKRTIKKPRR